MWRTGCVAAVAILCACGEDSPGTVELCAYRAAFAAYRDGNGPWQTVAPDARGVHVLRVTDDFEYVLVRVYTGNFNRIWTYTTRSTLDDWLAMQHGSATSCEDPDEPRVSVSGQLAQAGDVTMDNRSIGLAAAGPFTLSVGRGVHDLVATSGNRIADGGKIVIRRDQAIEAATMVPLIDIDAEGSDFVGVPITVSGASAAPLSTTVYLVDTRNGDVAFVSERTGTAAGVVPADLLGASSQQWLSLFAGAQSADIRYAGSPPSVELLPPLTGITFSRGDGVSATWGTLPSSSFSYVQLSLSGSAAAAPLVQYTFSTRGWIAKHGTTSLAFDSSVPGFDPAWRLDNTQPFDATFSLVEDTADTFLSTSVTTDETMTPRKQPRPASWSLDAVRALRR
jgi:hypothetical protein